jgi:hypothetical protein
MGLPCFEIGAARDGEPGVVEAGRQLPSATRRLLLHPVELGPGRRSSWHERAEFRFTVHTAISGREWDR